MIIRSALLLGSVAADEQPAFDAYMRDVVVPEIGTYPGIRAVTLRKLVQADAGAPSVYMQFDLVFDSLEDMEVALASPVRAAVRDRIKAGMAPFVGTVTHVVSEAMAG
jgi:uncharacterized protein (TIGR02118 family)